MGPVLVVVAVAGGEQAASVARELDAKGYRVVRVQPNEAPEIASRFSPPLPLPPLSLFPHTPISLSPPSPLTPSLPVARRKKRATSEASPPTLHRQVVDLFVELWKQLRGGDYRVVGGRDGQAVKSLLRYPEATLPEIKRRMLVALSDPWFKTHGHLALFVSRWSNYDGRAPVGEQQRQGPPAPAPRAEGRRVESIADVLAMAGSRR